MRILSRTLVAAVGLWAAAVWQTIPGEAHKAITSKYLYNEDVFPVFKAHCGRCHVEGGVAPMSLMTYDEASPWAESLRIELLADTIPAWHPLKLTARELDLVLVWATGGAPRGKPENAPPPVTLASEWPAGPPDLELPMPAPFTLEGTAAEATHDVELPLAKAAGRSVRAVDLKPGTPAIVRSATLLLKSGSGAPRELGTWVPGQDHGGAALRAVAGPGGRGAGGAHPLQAHLEIRGAGDDRRQHARPVLRRVGHATPDAALTSVRLDPVAAAGRATAPGRQPPAPASASRSPAPTGCGRTKPASQ